jgi:hypothetical protein
VDCCQQYQCCSRHPCNGIGLESVHGRQSSTTCRTEKLCFGSVDQQLALADPPIWNILLHSAISIMQKDVPNCGLASGDC